ncbi:hypothetical protein [Desulfobotulus mexicanus]|uniref:Uncharacterized protein n=1 Tax=Desulfobotulus mexicanus TaxID=2586642 RepID=A0A5S5MEJ3_9BACT|nr:hypothetical protein [Desulfobotulus mexicanus]TYT74045.1 hypothetical protein FIM25_12225 [Desulfobotulus mexicanus]
MFLENLTIDPRFCGPSQSGNGGYVCGRIAGHISDTASVSLRVPPPLEKELCMEKAEDRVRLMDGDILIGEGASSELDIKIPDFISFEEAVEASKNYAGFRHHSFPRCFVCGTLREEGDGLRIFAGGIKDKGLVASPWIVDASLAGEDGRVSDAFIWAALDCPGAFAVASFEKGKAIVLGQLEARIEGKVKPGDRCIAMGWPLGVNGRKRMAGSAVFSESGDLLGLARAVWVEIPENLFPPENPCTDSV